MEIKIPETIKIQGQLPWSFYQCVEYVVDTNPQFADRSGARAGARILAALLDRPVAELVEVRKEDLAVLYTAFDKPVAGWCPLISSNEQPIVIGARVFVSYIDAVPPP